MVTRSIAFVPPAARGSAPLTRGDMPRGIVKPPCNRRRGDERPGAFGKQCEDGLRGILRIVRIADDPMAHPQHHRSMPVN
jgi:hypothetical protein